MKEKLLQYLACPQCAGDFRLDAITSREENEILEAVLECTSCSQHFPVLRGVPRFADLDQVEKDKAETAENFGWQWQHFTQKDDKYADQFLGWIGPVKPEFFRDKLVVEGGCGKGRHTQLAAEWGAALDSQDPEAYDLFNSSFLIGPDGEFKASYRKRRLVASPL